MQDWVTLILLATILAGILLAYANGANDNFKGVATLLGSRTTTYRRALSWATLTTILGSVTALFLAKQLIIAFSGKGLVPPSVVDNPVFAGSAAFAAAVTVLAATRIGFPVSTTHALIGGLIGAGLVLTDGNVYLGKLANGFVLPLLLSPAISIALAGVIYPPLRAMRIRLGIVKESRVSVREEVLAATPGEISTGYALNISAGQSLTVTNEPERRIRYSGNVMGVNAGTMLDIAHYLSAGAVSFARGLNDTPKIAAVLLVGNAMGTSTAIAGVAALMATGGILSARRVAETISYRVTEMNAGQGLVANLVTAVLVIFASRFGMPVSTTHVSCGSLFGIGAATGQLHWQTIKQIALAWAITLPVAVILGSAFAALLTAL